MNGISDYVSTWDSRVREKGLEVSKIEKKDNLKK
jgi:hypothetical protein